MRSIEALIPSIVDIARTAGEAILSVYDTGFTVDKKPDSTPVTAADYAANRIVVGGLRKLGGDIPLISEENDLPAYRERARWQRYWLVDPLDGTREFIDRNGEFTVNIALIEKTAPQLGVVYVPVSGITYTGCRGVGAMKIPAGGTPTPIKAATRSHDPVRILGSRSHRGDSLDDWLAAIGEHKFRAAGSSLKFCLIAEGAADVYPRFGPTSEWDTAAAQAVTEAAGGRVLKLDGAPLDYNTKADIRNPHFVVIGPGDRDWLDHTRPDYPG